MWTGCKKMINLNGTKLNKDTKQTATEVAKVQYIKRP